MLPQQSEAMALSGGGKANLRFFSTFRPAMFLVLYNFLADGAWHSKTSALPGSRVPATKMPGNTGILGTLKLNSPDSGEIENVPENEIRHSIECNVVSFLMQKIFEIV